MNVDSSMSVDDAQKIYSASLIKKSFKAVHPQNSNVIVAEPSAVLGVYVNETQLHITVCTASLVRTVLEQSVHPALPLRAYLNFESRGDASTCDSLPIDRYDAASVKSAEALNALPCVLFEREVKEDVDQKDLRWDISLNGMIEDYRNYVRGTEYLLAGSVRMPNDSLQRRLRFCPSYSEYCAFRATIPMCRGRTTVAAERNVKFFLDQAKERAQRIDECVYALRKLGETDPIDEAEVRRLLGEIADLIHRK